MLVFVDFVLHIFIIYLLLFILMLILAALTHSMLSVIIAVI